MVLLVTQGVMKFVFDRRTECLRREASESAKALGTKTAPSSCTDLVRSRRASVVRSPFKCCRRLFRACNCIA